MRRITVAAVIVLIAMAATVNAQQGTADLRGRIVDSQQAVMPGVTVTVRNQGNGTFRTTVRPPWSSTTRPQSISARSTGSHSRSSRTKVSRLVVE